MPNSLIAFLTDLVRYFPKIPNRTEPNNTKPKLRYSVNSVRFGPPLIARSHKIVILLGNANFSLKNPVCL